jgi:hypothetical protein
MFFYFFYSPLIFWLIFFISDRFRDFSTLLLGKLVKVAFSIDGEYFTLKKFLYSTVTSFLIFNLTAGAIGGLYNILIGFSDSDNTFELQAIFEIAFMTNIVVAIKFGSGMILNFTFAKKVVKSEENPRGYISHLHLKYFLKYMLYNWIFLNIYYQISKDFIVLKGGPSLVIPLLF